MELTTISDLVILLVEPSNTQWRAISAILRGLGVEHAQWRDSGAAAIASLDQVQPDLVISAMHLPDMTGVDLVHAIRNNAKWTALPFMLVSSETGYRYLDPIKQAGVIAMLPKPFEPAALRGALYATLDYLTPETETLGDTEFSSLRVLLVDDSVMSRNHLKRLLANMGISQVTEAINGSEARAYIDKSFFDLVVTDYDMPEMDGKALTEYIRTKSSQGSVPVLMVTAAAEGPQLAGVKQCGVSAVVDKPFEPQVIKSLVRKLLQQGAGGSAR